VSKDSQIGPYLQEELVQYMLATEIQRVQEPCLTLGIGSFSLWFGDY
jgi:hypothetical protein